MHTEEEKSEALRCVREDDHMVKLTFQVGEETGVGTGRETSGVTLVLFLVTTPLKAVKSQADVMVIAGISHTRHFGKLN